jgi:predicted aspartyl protease
MMFGLVNQQREAVLKLAIIGNRSQKIAVDAVVDTGFNGDLILLQAGSQCNSQWHRYHHQSGIVGC